MVATLLGSSPIRGICTALLTLLLTWGPGAAAQVPEKINYQGKLTNPGGQPIDGVVSMVFNLYAAAAGGATLYTETQSVTVTSGIFNVAIGSATPLTLPFDIPYYLGITIAPDAEMSPRQALLSSPYARRAANAGDAQTLGGHSAADLDARYILAGSAIPGAEIAGSISVATVPAVQITGVVGTAQIADNAITQSKLSPITVPVAGQVLGTDGSILQWQTPGSGTTGTVTSISGGTGIVATPNPVTGVGALGLASGYQLPQGCGNGQIPKSDGAGGWTCADATLFSVSRSVGPPPFTYYCNGTPYGSAQGTEAAAAVTDCIGRANANGGGIVYVKSGIYSGSYNIALGVGVDLIGQGILQPTGPGIALSGGNLVDSVGIDMSLSGGSAALTVTAAGDEDGDDVTIRNVKFYNGGVGASAIYVDSSNFSIGNIKILDNLFTQNLASAGMSSPGAGFCSYGGVIVFNTAKSISNSVVSQNVILAKACSGGVGTGIVFAGGGTFNRFTLTDNQIVGQGSFGQEGVQVLAGTTLQNSVISGNILNNILTGFDVPAAVYLVAANNRITCANRKDAIGIDIGPSAAVSGNVIQSCGLGIRAKNQSTVTGNHINYAGNAAPGGNAMTVDPCGYGGQTYSVGVCMQTALVTGSQGAVIRGNVTSGYYIGILGWKNLSANCSAGGNMNIAFVSNGTYPDSGTNGVGNNCNFNNLGN